VKSLNDLHPSGQTWAVDVLAAPARMLLWRDVVRLAAHFRQGNYECPALTTEESLRKAYKISVDLYEAYAEINRKNIIRRVAEETGCYPPEMLVFFQLAELRRWGWRTPIFSELWEDEKTEITWSEMLRAADNMEPERPNYQKTGVV
ncbi:MAG: hypothetical protein M0P69_15100, partial [Bacteroidales bacterium]|nr:hypothetical protein [Bacteroidales bacterium]